MIAWGGGCESGVGRERGVGMESITHDPVRAKFVVCNPPLYELGNMRI